jgi:methylitaconate Delta-isomerase
MHVLGKTKTMTTQIPIKTVLMRGGSSKAVFLRTQDVPTDERKRTALLLALFGSPDRRQIDGLGGADYLTSKCALMGPPTRPDADIDYTVGQVSVEHPLVSYDTNCGNISAAAGLYAVEEGYVPATGPETLVRVHNTNTGKILRMKIPVENGKAVTEGNFAIDGVPGTGAEIKMDFSLTAGAATGQLLPTGRPVDRIEVETLGKSIDISIVDIANICVYIKAQDLGLIGTELPGTFSEKTLDTLEEIRRKAAVLAGIDSYLLPFQVLVSEPRDYPEFLTGRTVQAANTDVVARLFVERTLHKAYAGTGATCLAVAAKVDGSVVHQMARSRNNGEVRIAHPSGVLPIMTDVGRQGDGWTVNEVLFSRTARRLMEGTAFVRPSALA